MSIWSWFKSIISTNESDMEDYIQTQHTLAGIKILKEILAQLEHQNQTRQTERIIKLMKGE